SSQVKSSQVKSRRGNSGATVAAHGKDINAVAVVPNDALVCSGSQDRTAKVWRLPDLSLSVTLRGHKRGVWSVAFSPVDRCVLTASGDATCRIWALADGSCLRTLQGHEASVLKAIFVTRGTQLVCVCAHGFRRRHVPHLGAGGRQLLGLRTLQGHEASVLKAIFVTRGTQ
ncbi:unnamed protein product, partial [Closterium sp. NIES-53]